MYGSQRYGSSSPARPDEVCPGEQAWGPTMTEPSFAERLRVLRLSARRSQSGRAQRRLGGIGAHWTSHQVAEYLLVPSDLRAPDPAVAAEFQRGTLSFDGLTVSFGRASPFLVDGAPEPWQSQLQGFVWLRDLASAGAVTLARQLMSDWLRHHGRSGGPAWRPELLARRTISLLSHADFLLEQAEPVFFEAVSKSLGLQLRALAATYRAARPGLPQLQCLLALLLADLAIAGRDRVRNEQRFLAELARQVHPDGGHVSRNPAAVLELLLDLLPLRRCYASRELATPAGLNATVERMLVFLRAMRLGNGSLARFNGVGPVAPEALATVMSFCTTEEPAPREFSGSGYVRLERGTTTLVMDCGSPPPLELAGAAQAGCLSFEMSDGLEPLLMNAGYPLPSRRRERPVARATASHNTLSVSGQSSARFVDTPSVVRLCGDAALSGPLQAPFRFMQHNGADAFEASHDGFAAAFQLIHRRRIELSPDGLKLECQDWLGPRHGVLRLGRDLPFAIHFHLAPGVGAIRQELDGRTIVDLTLPRGGVWRFSADGAGIQIEASTRYDTTVSAPTCRQIVLRGACSGETAVTWALARQPA